LVSSLPITIERYFELSHDKELKQTENIDWLVLGDQNQSCIKREQLKTNK
jgi:hypothetical protein